MFNIEYNKVVSWLLPTAEQRKTKTQAFLMSCLAPLITLYNTFLVFRESALKRLSYTSQIIYLEKLLNDKHNSAAYTTDSNPPVWDPPIYIDNTADVDYVYIANKSEGYAPLMIKNKADAGDPVYIGSKAEYERASDFIVMVPAALEGEFDENEMKSIINIYKLAGKRYKIQYYE